MDTDTYKTILQRGYILDELELERALIIYRKLRLLADADSLYKVERKKLRQLIKDYEDKHWNSEIELSDEKIKESDNAEFIAEQERKFVLNRKIRIREKLNELGLNQQDLGAILGHNKTYISELMNGVSPFSLKDLIIIHRLFLIKLEILIPTIIPQLERGRIKDSIQKINKPNLNIKFNKSDIRI